jgi:hypothetical protein
MHQMTDVVGRIAGPAIRFAENNLAECASDLIEWRQSGICPGGSFKKCADLIPSYLDQMQWAEYIVTKCALYSAANPPNPKADGAKLPSSD